MQPDPIGLEGGLNPYLYANGNPLRYTDPEGMQAGEITIPASIAIARGCLSNAYCAGTVGAATGVALTCLINPDLCKTAVGLACQDVSQATDDFLKPFLNEDKKLTPGEIKELKGKGIDPEDLKGGRATGKLDLFKDRKGNIVIKPKDGSGPGEPTGININDL